MGPPRGAAAHPVRQRRPFVSPTGLGEIVRVCATPVFVPPREPWRNATIEHFNDTFDKRFFRQAVSPASSTWPSASAFERFRNAHHRYSATRGHTPDETARATTQRTPPALEELPAGWPERERVEYIRFIRSDDKLRVLGRTIPMPDGSAYQYVTATLDLTLPADEHNLLICDDHGQLLTTGRFRSPAR